MLGGTVLNISTQYNACFTCTQDRRRSSVARALGTKVLGSISDSATFFAALWTVMTPVVSCRRVAKRTLDLAFSHCACLQTWPSSNGLAVFTLKNIYMHTVSAEHSYVRT